MRKSWQNSPKLYAKIAREAIGLGVQAHRDAGVKACASLDCMAPDLQATPRRVRRLFENDRDPNGSLDECQRCLLGVARLLRRLAARLRDRADRWDREADELERRQKQLCLWESGKCLTAGKTRSRGLQLNATERHPELAA